MIIRGFIYVLLFGLALIADQAVKFFSVHQEVAEYSIGLIGRLGLEQYSKSIAIALVGVVLIVLLIVRTSRFFLPLLLILAGGASNALDRIIRGAVVDPFTISSFSFNIADMLIVGGSVFLVWRVFASRS